MFLRKFDAPLYQTTWCRNREAILNITRAFGKYLFPNLCNNSVNCMVRIMWEKVDVGPFLKVGVVFDWITIKLQTFLWGGLM